jgi:hypothetical protein
VGVRSINRNGLRGHYERHNLTAIRQGFEGHLGKISFKGVDKITVSKIKKRVQRGYIETGVVSPDEIGSEALRYSSIRRESYL